MPSPKPPSTRSSGSDLASPGVLEKRTTVCPRNPVMYAIAFLGFFSLLAAPYVVLDVWSSFHLFEGAVQKPPPTLASEFQTVAPFIFDSVQGLLQQWPNSYSPNGHSIVAGSIAPATVLYHAKHAPGPPKKPTFFAFDAEMSVGIYGGFGRSNLHVYRTTRPLNIIYFDGQSATLTALGTLDSQISILQGRVPLYPDYDLIYDEDQRALDLCELVKKLGIDGVVRMDAGFEVLVCDYHASRLQPLFVTNITVPGNMEEDPEGLPRDPNRQPPRGFGNVFSEQGSYEWLRSASWHYGREGGLAENRVQLDICRMVSFYDPELTSLAKSHHGRLVGNYSFVNGWGFRKGHRLLDIQPDDVNRVRSWLQTITSSTTSKENRCSGINWQAIFTTIHAQHGTRAREIGAAFEWKSGTEAERKAIITKVHELTHAILAPYLEYIVSDSDKSLTPREQTIARCSTVYTAGMDLTTLGRSEVLLYHSLNIVTERLCTWEWDLFEWSEKHTTNYWGDQPGDAKISAWLNDEEVARYRQLSEDTLSLIGWDLWTKCDRQCMFDEICAIPTWPVVYAPGLPQGGIYSAHPPKLSEDEMLDFWRPKCINRADFDRGGGRGRDPIHQFPDVPPY